MSDDHVTYNFEYDKRVRACFIGAGGHSFRNVYPALQYAPVDLRAVCDVNEAQAATYARQFGAERSYTDYREMLDREQPEAVFIVTGYTDDGRLQATDIALEALAAGAHVWMEKPTAASTDEVRALMKASTSTSRFVMTGLKKTFTPANERVKSIIDSEEFGGVSSITLRYPISMPPLEERSDLNRVRDLLDHIFHPAAILHYLMGPIRRLSYLWEPASGGSVLNLEFESGAVGAMHFVAGMSGSSPLERLEVVGNGANIVVENGVRVTYYRPAQRGEYGRSASYLVPNDSAPLHWEPEFSLGQLYNKNIFMLGYVSEIRHFCTSVLADTAPTRGTLEASCEILKLFEALCANPPGEMIELNPPR